MRMKSQSILPANVWLKDANSDKGMVMKAPYNTRKIFAVMLLTVFWMILLTILSGNAMSYVVVVPAFAGTMVTVGVYRSLTT